MKSINMSQDERDVLFDKLYDACESTDAFFVVRPKKGIIEVYEEDLKVAEIKLIEVDDAYDVVKKIFNNQ